MLPQLSKQQNKVIKKLLNYNVIVNSVAGSGKTTTNLHIAKHFPNSNILLLTYNAKLKLETRIKIKNYNINNMEAHSFHSFAVKYINNKSFNDKNLHLILDKPLINNFNYHIIIIDEAQDITPLYFKLIKHIITSNSYTPKIAIVGDYAQSIFQFNNSDPRFITHAQQIFNFNDFPWYSITLSTSFRITKNIAKFINKCCLHQKRLVANKTGKKPRYIITDTRKKNITIINLFIQLLNKYSPEDFFILSPSVKNNAPCRIIENILKTKFNIPIYVSNSDTEKIDEDIIKNKMVFSTFHQVKGLERKIVIIYSFDLSYFKFYNIHADPNICPNELYVALTRPTHKLFLLHQYDQPFLPFLNTKLLDKYTKVFGNIKNNIYHTPPQPFLKTPVTDITSHLPFQILQKAKTFFDIKPIKNKNKIIDIPIKTTQDMGDESVADITGIAIPAFFELITTSNIDFYKTISYHYPTLKINKQNLPFNLLDIDINNISIQQLLFISNFWKYFKDGYIFKLYQIQNYDWLTQSHIDQAISRIKNLNIIDPKFEVKFSIDNSNSKYPFLSNRQIIGFVDCLSQDSVFEFKCVNQLTDEHFIQLAIYMFLIPSFQNYNFYLYNIIDDQMFQITSTQNKLNQMIQFLLEHKYSKKQFIPDDIFLQNIHNIKSNQSNIPIPIDLSQNIMILDTETTGIPTKKSFQPQFLHNFDNARLIELGYIIYSNKNITKKYNQLVKPKGFTINNSHIHNITTKQCFDKGIPIKNILKQFYQDLLKVDIIICHNVQFDINILLNEIYRNKMNDLYNTLLHFNTFCTLNFTQQIYSKKIKLINWYNHLFNSNLSQTHRAIDDALLVASCIFK